MLAYEVSRPTRTTLLRRKPNFALFKSPLPSRLPRRRVLRRLFPISVTWGDRWQRLGRTHPQTREARAWPLPPSCMVRRGTNRLKSGRSSDHRIGRTLGGRGLWRPSTIRRYRIGQRQSRTTSWLLASVLSSGAMRPRFAVLRCRDGVSLTQKWVARGPPRGHSHRREGRGEQFAASSAGGDDGRRSPALSASVLRFALWLAAYLLLGLLVAIFVQSLVDWLLS
jgi:hypothetical protein